MWNPIAAIFGSPKSVGKIVDGAIKGLDKLHLSDEERLDAQRDMIPIVTNWMAKTTGQDMARRTLVFLVAVPWTITVMSKLILALMDKQTVTLDGLLGDTINQPFMLVMIFYFAPHAITAFTGAIKK